MEKVRFSVTIYIYLLACISTLLDGFILIFIGYNSSILTKMNKWEESKIFYLDLNFHFSSALGGLFCLLFAKDTNREALNLAAIVTLIAFLVSIALINISSFFIYLSVFSIICISNGHLQNICVNAIVKKFSEKTRAVFWGYAYFFNQFGKFLFASLIFKFDKDVKDGKIDITIFPIFTIIMVQIVFIIILLTLMNKRSLLKQKISIKKESLKSKANKEKRHLLGENDSSLVNCNLGAISKIDLFGFDKERNCYTHVDNNFSKNYNNNFITNINKKFILDKQIDKKEANKQKEENGKANKGNNIRSSTSNLSNLLIGNFRKDSKKKNYSDNKIKNKSENFSADDIENKNNEKKNPETFEFQMIPQIQQKKNNNNKNHISINNNYKKQPLSNKEYIISTLKAIFAQQIFYHQFSMIFINFSLGIQFFSLINIFPHLHYNYTYSVLTEEIFFSKLIHLILLFFFPLLFLFKKLTRKAILLFAFSSNFIINALVLVNCINSTAFVHIFRFIWNICYITTNLYNCEAAPFKVRYLNTSIMNLFFKLSCMIEITVIERLMRINLFLPVVLNLFILLMDNLLVSKLEFETHFKSLAQIKFELN